MAIFGAGAAGEETKITNAKAAPATSTNEDRKEPEEPHDCELNTIDKKTSPAVEVGSRFCSPVNPDHITRDEEGEEDANAGEDCDPAPRDCTPVNRCTPGDCRRIEDKPDEREREGKNDKDHPSCPSSYQCFPGIGK